MWMIFSIRVISFRRRSFRVDYLVQSLSSNVNVNNLTPPPNSAFDQLYGQYVNVSLTENITKRKMIGIV